MISKYPSFTLFRRILKYSLAYVMHITTNLSQQNLRRLATKGVFFLLIKSFRIEFHGKLHDDLNSIFAVFNINQNLWIKK